MSEPFVPIEELAKHLTVSIPTVRSWLRQGIIPTSTYIKVGNTYRFSISEVVAAFKNPPAPEVIEPKNEQAPVQLELDFGNHDKDI